MNGLLAPGGVGATDGATEAEVVVWVELVVLVAELLLVVVAAEVVVPVAELLS